MYSQRCIESFGHFIYFVSKQFEIIRVYLLHPAWEVVRSQHNSEAQHERLPFLSLGIGCLSEPTPETLDTIMGDALYSSSTAVELGSIRSGNVSPHMVR